MENNIFDWLYFKQNAFIQKIRAIRKFYFFRRMDIKLGHNVLVQRGKGRHFFGNRNVVFDNSIFEVYNTGASITTGNGCFFSFGVVLVCSQAITLGNNVWIGEYTSIRDSSHRFSTAKELGSLGDIIEPVTIGNNVWIGRGSLILQGTIIENNVIIAANSVVKGHCIANAVYGGCPAKFIKYVDAGLPADVGF